MQIQEILIVKNAQENYGISTEDINQISRVPDLMPLPLRPFGVRGLCSVSGGVLSMVDMNRLLDMPEVDIEDPKSRIISLNDDLSSNTLLVSDVFNTVEIEEENIEYLDIKDDPVIAIYKYNDMLVQVLSLEALFLKMKKVDIASKEISNGKIKTDIVKEEESSRFLIFSMSNERYALNIDYLQEIILADVNYTPVAGTKEELLGLITLRDELLMVLDLRLYYGFEPRVNDENRILIVSYDGKKIGLCIDAIIDIKSFYQRDIEPMSDRLQDSKIAGVIHAEDYLISFFDAEVINEIFRENEAFIDSVSDEVQERESTEYGLEAIVFKLAGKEYAFSVDNVDEIIDMVPSTKVAFTENSIDGIINIRGQIVTTVSLFKKLDLEPVVDINSKIIVCNINGDRIGFVVDSISDIINVKVDEIKEEQNGYFNNILHLDNGERLVLSMDIDKILNEENIDG